MVRFIFENFRSIYVLYYDSKFNRVVIEGMCMCRELRVMKVEKNTSTYSARVVIHNNTSKPFNDNSVKSRANS